MGLGVTHGGGGLPPSSSLAGLGKRHRVGLVALATAFVVSGAGVLAFARARRGIEPMRPVPFVLDSLVGVDAAGAPVRLDGSEVRVLLYVSEGCPYCAVELERWARTLASGTGRLRPLVVLSPESSTEGMGYLPAALRSAWIRDASGGVARSVGLRAVPFRAVLDGAGTVVEVASGLTPPERIDALSDPLTRDPPTSTGGEP